MKKLAFSTLATTLLTIASLNVNAADVCKVSMMGRVCYAEGSIEATAAHMKGDAVADASKRKEAENDTSSKNDNSAKKVAAK